MGASKLSETEANLIDKMQKQGKMPKDILAKLQKDRACRGSAGPGSSAVYNFLAGLTHKRGAEETRGGTETTVRYEGRRGAARAHGWMQSL